MCCWTGVSRGRSTAMSNDNEYVCHKAGDTTDVETANSNVKKSQTMCKFKHACWRPDGRFQPDLTEAHTEGPCRIAGSRPRRRVSTSMAISCHEEAKKSHSSNKTLPKPPRPQQEPCPNPCDNAGPHQSIWCRELCGRNAAHVVLSPEHLCFPCSQQQNPRPFPVVTETVLHASAATTGLIHVLRQSGFVFDTASQEKATHERGT